MDLTKARFKRRVVILFLTILLIYVFINQVNRIQWVLGVFRTENKFEDIYVSEAARRQPIANNSIFIWVMTAPKNHNKRVDILSNTWLRRFPHATIFTSSRMENESIPYRTTFKGFDDGYYSLFYKIRFGFYYAYKAISDRFDWYIKSDDDMYVIKEHLEKILIRYDPDKPHYIGCKTMSRLNILFNGRGFYILSRATMKLFVEQLYHNKTACPFYFHEDVGMARCLASVGIYPTEPKDEKGRRFFNMGSLVDHYYESHDFTSAISPNSVTLHLTNPEQMLFADLFYYHMQ